MKVFIVNLIYITMKNFISYSKKVSAADFEKLHIYIDEQADIDEGVIIFCNNTISGKSSIEKDTVLKSGNVIDNSTIENGCTVTNSVITDSLIKSRCNIGPFAHIRNESEIGENCRIGNFVEIKKTVISNGCKIAHLSYIGDAELGKNCNVGCGVVFCNYDGKNKHKTYVGDNVFIGSNCNLIAPLTICDGAFLAAGSTITTDVDADILAIARAKQVNKKNYKNPYKND